MAQVSEYLNLICGGNTTSPDGEDYLYILGVELAKLIDSWTEDEFSLVNQFSFFARYIKDLNLRYEGLVKISNGITDTAPEHESYLRVLLKLVLGEADPESLLKSVEHFTKRAINGEYTVAELLERYTVSYAFLPVERYLESYGNSIVKAPSEGAFGFQIRYYRGNSPAGDDTKNLTGDTKNLTVECDPYLFRFTSELGTRMLTVLTEIFRPLHLAISLSHNYFPPETPLPTEETKGISNLPAEESHPLLQLLIQNGKLASCNFLLGEVLRGFSYRQPKTDADALQQGVRNYHVSLYKRMKGRIAFRLPPLLEYSIAYVGAFYDNTDFSLREQFGERYLQELLQKFSFTTTLDQNPTLRRDVALWTQRLG